MSQNAIHKVNFQTSIVHVKEIKERDRARAKHLVAGHHPHGPNARKAPHHQAGGGSSTAHPSISVANNGVTYIASCGVGSPATQCNLLIDTGSSNTWVKKEVYKPTSTSKDTRKTFSIGYGSGSCSGTEYTDQFTLSDELVIQNQSIGVADKADQMDGIDGILGIGPVDLTQNTMAADASNPKGIPTVMDNLLSQGGIQTECIGISYRPSTDVNAPDGTLSFGGADSSMYTGKLNYVPITSQSPASMYWGIDQSIMYGNTQIMAKSAGISDTGTTLIMIPQDAFDAYREKTGAKLDQSSGLLTVTQAQYEKMESMYFCIGNEKYELTPNAQIWPRSMNSTIGAPDGTLCLVFATMGDIQQGSGLCFINGFSFLQRFYSVYDTTNSQVGYATTEYTNATTN